MRKLMPHLVGMAFVSTTLLMSHGAQAAGPGISFDIRTTLGATGSVEKAACVRRRVCGFRGCIWRTVCRRWR